MRKISKTITILLASAIAIPAVSAEAPAPSANEKAANGQNHTDKKPNILFILVDDLRNDLGSYAHPTIHTPHMDKFAQSALVFDNAITQQPVCAPSRAALMTGLRPDTSGITTLEQPLDKTIPNVTTILDSFKSAGYDTLGYGKVYHHKDDDANGWTLRTKDAEFDFRRAERKAGNPHNAMGRFPDDVKLPDELNIEMAKNNLADYGQSGSKSGTPFFMAMGIHRPHLPFYANERDYAHYNDQDITNPVNPNGQKGAPPWAIASYEVYSYDDTPAEAPMGEAKTRAMRMAYMASISLADRLVGDILGELKKQGLEDNTIVVLWSDHGWKLGDHAGWAKHSTVNMDIRIPMMIRVPGMTQGGSRTEAMVETVDLYPTLAELAGIAIQGETDGLSLRPLLAQPEQPWKEAAFSQQPRNVAGKGRLLGRTVRTQRYRYTAWMGDNGQGDIVAQELYDLVNDPNESVNLADKPAYQSQLQHLENLRQNGWQYVRNNIGQNHKK